MNVVQRVLRAIVDPGEPVGLPGMMTGLGRGGGIGEPPTRGTSQQLQAFNHMPWLRAVTGKVATSVASAACRWQLFHAEDRTRASVKMLQKASPMVRDQLVTKRVRAGTLVEVTDHPLLDALHRANDMMTGIGLFEVTQISLDLIGESFWGIELSQLGIPFKFWPIPSHWVQDTPTPSRPTFRVSWRGWQEELPDPAVMWMRRPDPWNPYGRGSGLAHALADELESDEYAANFQRAFFSIERDRTSSFFQNSKERKDTRHCARRTVSRSFEESWLQKALSS